MLQFFQAANAGLLCAQSSFFTEGVTPRTNRTVLQRGSEWTLLEAKVTIPGGIEVFTNGTFRVNEGKMGLSLSEMAPPPKWLRDRPSPWKGCARAGNLGVRDVRLRGRHTDAANIGAIEQIGLSILAEGNDEL